MTHLKISRYILITVSLIFTRIRQTETELTHAGGRTNGQDIHDQVYRRFSVLGSILKIKATYSTRHHSGARLDGRLRGWVGFGGGGGTAGDGENVIW